MTQHVLSFILAVLMTAQVGTDRTAPYSCRRLYDEQRKCAMNQHCDKRPLERLTRECLRDGGRP